MSMNNQNRKYSVVAKGHAQSLSAPQTPKTHRAGQYAAASGTSPRNMGQQAFPQESPGTLQYQQDLERSYFQQQAQNQYPTDPNSVVPYGSSHSSKSLNRPSNSANSNYSMSSTRSMSVSYSSVTGGGGQHDEDEANVRVVVRVRPMNEAELRKADRIAVVCMDDGQTIQVSSKKIWLMTSQALKSSWLKVTGPDASNKNGKPLTFHSVNSEYSTQESVFETCGVKSLVEQALRG
jgi:hypothetical protein